MKLKKGQIVRFFTILISAAVFAAAFFSFSTLEYHRTHQVWLFGYDRVHDLFGYNRPVNLSYWFLSPLLMQGVIFSSGLTALCQSAWYKNHLRHSDGGRIRYQFLLLITAVEEIVWIVQSLRSLDISPMVSVKGFFFFQNFILPAAYAALILLAVVLIDRYRLWKSKFIIGPIEIRVAGKV